MPALLTQPLSDRALVRVAGEDAGKFLQGIVTCDVDDLAVGETRFGALLSPQGKILFDFFVVRSLQGYLLDVADAMRDDLVRRLEFYKLRAKVDIGAFDERTSVHACWGGAPDELDGVCAVDPRLAAMGWRAYARRAPQGTPGDYQAHRIAIGMPEGGRDFTFGDTFPHEALMDQFGGVDFAKGCYVGQEVVSRMQHRGTARSRIVMVRGESTLPAFGTEILAAGKISGKMGSSAGTAGLAMVRLDRVREAIDAGAAVIAGALPVTLHIQDWASYDWPKP